MFYGLRKLQRSSQQELQEVCGKVQLLGAGDLGTTPSLAACELEQVVGVQFFWLLKEDPY